MLSGNVRPLRRLVLAGVVASAAVAAGTTAPASAENYGELPPGHLSGWADGVFTLRDSRNTVVEVAPGEDLDKATASSGIATRRAATVTISQRYCDTAGATDHIVERNVTVDTQRSTGISVTALLDRASTDRTPFRATGTETRTPAGTDNRCTEATGAPTSTPLTVNGTTTISWRRNNSAAPIYWDNPYEQASLFYYRGATASGRITASALGLDNTMLPRTTDAWIWQGVWWY